MDVETDVEQLIQQAQQKQRSTATQRRAAKERQRKHRQKVAQDGVQFERDQRAEENWNERRKTLQVTSLFEVSCGVLCDSADSQMQVCREFGRRMGGIRPIAGDTYSSFFRKVLATWVGRNYRSVGICRAEDRFIWSVRFDYHAEHIESLLAEMMVGVDPDALIDIASLPAIPFKCTPPKAAQPIDPKVQAHHDALDQSRRDLRCIIAGKFSVIDDGQNFKITPDGADAYKFPRTFPTDLLWCSWNILKLADLYLQNNPDDCRFDPDTRARIHRVWTFRQQVTRTNFTHVEAE